MLSLYRIMNLSVVTYQKMMVFVGDVMFQVGGYVVEYENITFVSVRGAGHFVPSYQPERALTLFSSFLEGKLP